MAPLAIHARLDHLYQKVLLYLCGSLFILVGLALICRYIHTALIRRAASVCKGSMWLLVGLSFYCFLRAGGLIATAILGESTALFFVPPTIVYLALMALLIFLWGSYSYQLAMMYSHRPSRRHHVTLCSVVLGAATLILGFCVASLALAPPKISSNSASDGTDSSSRNGVLASIFTEVYIALDCCSCVVTGVALLYVSYQIGGSFGNQAASIDPHTLHNTSFQDRIPHPQQGSHAGAVGADEHSNKEDTNLYQGSPKSYGSEEEDPLVMSTCGIGSRRPQSYSSGAINSDHCPSANSSLGATGGYNALTAGYCAIDGYSPTQSGVAQRTEGEPHGSKLEVNEFGPARRSESHQTALVIEREGSPDANPIPTSSSPPPLNISLNEKPNRPVSFQHRFMLLSDELRQLFAAEHAPRRILLSIQFFGIYSILRAPLSIVLIVAGTHFDCQPEVSFGFYIIECLCMVVSSAALIGPSAKTLVPTNDSLTKNIIESPHPNAVSSISEHTEASREPTRHPHRGSRSARQLYNPARASRPVSNRLLAPKPSNAFHK